MKRRVEIATEAQAEACRRAGLLPPGQPWESFTLDVRDLDTYRLWPLVDAGLLSQNDVEQELRRRRRNQPHPRWRR